MRKVSIPRSHSGTRPGRRVWHMKPRTLYVAVALLFAAGLLLMIFGPVLVTTVGNVPPPSEQEPNRL